MTHYSRIALFGGNSLGLLLGQAVRLSDSSGLELYDPDPQAALRGSLFLGVSAWTSLQTPQETKTLDIDLVLLAEPNATPDFSLLTTEGPSALLIIKFFADQICDQGRLVCQALPSPLEGLDTLEITKKVPEMTFHLSGTSEAVKRGREALTALSNSFSVQLGA